MITTRASLLIAIALAWSAALGFSISAQDQATPANVTVWTKVYTEGQAKRGEAAYVTACSACHAEDLSGSDMIPRLKGADFASRWNGRTIGDFFERLTDVMPPDDPGGLPRETYLDLTAFLLKANGYPAGDTELAGEIERLKQIAITAKP